MKKVVMGLIMAALALFLMWINTKTLFVYDSVIFLFSAAGVYEIARAFRKLDYKVMTAPLLCAALAVYPAFYFFGESGILISIFAAFMISGIIYVLKGGITFKDVSATLFSLVYPLGFLASAYLINHMGGSFLLLFTLLIGLITDSAAYFVGKCANIIRKGQAKKLIPRVSPKKTVAGAVGGVVVCMLIITLYWYLIEYGVIDLGFKMRDVLGIAAGFELIAYLSTALAASVISILGDLLASRIKRECGLKDFGNLIPGHGGVLDRIDAIMFVMVTVYAVCRFF